MGLIFGDGEKAVEVESVQVIEEATDDDNKASTLTLYNNDTATLEITTKIDRNTYLSLLHGRKITNNYLKMHGGIMTRKPSRCRRNALCKSTRK